MLDKLTYFWKFLHFSIYSWLRYFQLTTNRMLGYCLRFEFAKHLWARRGVYGEDAIKKRINFETANAKWSPVVLQAGIHMGGILVILQFSIVFFILGILGGEALSLFFEYVYFYGLIFLVLAGVINYFLLFKEDRYLIDFAKFEKLPRRALLKYKILSFFLICSVIASFFISLLWAVGRS